METRLQQLFDLQYFMQNSRLQSVISDVLVRYGVSDDTRLIRHELEEDDLEMLYAAGDVHAAAASSLRAMASGMTADKKADAAQTGSMDCIENLISGDFK